MRTRIVTAASAAIAIVASGFVPAPASLSPLVAAAEAGPPSQGSSKGSRGKQRKVSKGKAPAGKQAAKTRKKGARKASGQSSKPKTKRVAAREAGPSRKRTPRGKRKAATMAAKPGLAVPTRLAAAAPTTPPPVPPRAAPSQRKKAKAKAPPPAKQATSRERKEKRVASATSSVMTRAVRPLGGGAPITPPSPQKSKQGKKSKFYFVPFRNWFGGGKKT
ncbi:hypothetical protein IM511_12110 [Erythrobacteraceae bacterium E2-1 Yellow Sea]|nr:hypothetical protein [Erythrobacteraceae bacterium E2-1 Yellow Sea]